MDSKKRFRRVLAAALAVLLSAAPVVRVSAEETTETEIILEPTAPAEQIPPEMPEEPVIPEATENSPEPEIPEDPETTEDLGIHQEPAALSWAENVVPMTAAEALAQPTGTENVPVQGTVVFVMEKQAVLQDETGGLRLSFGEEPDVQPGDILLAMGCRSGGLAVTDYKVTGTGELPAVETTLEADRSALRILVRGASLCEEGLSQNGFAYDLEADIPEELNIGDRVDAWGVILDAVFYADTILPAEEIQEVPSAPVLESWNLYFGLLHAHTEISDGEGTVGEAFAEAAMAENLDFFAVTDHSDSFDNGDQGMVTAEGSEISQEWAAGKAAAEAVTGEDFLGIFGYEMTWRDDAAIGHINTFGTPGWQTRDQDGMENLAGYLDALAAVPGAVSQFNHPGFTCGDFYNFSRHTPQQDDRMHLLEVGGEEGGISCSYYTKALDKGWHLAPSNSQNNHTGNFGTASAARTVVLAQELTEYAIFDAIRNYRVYATEDRDLQILFHLNDRIMGSTVGQTDALTARITVIDGSGDSVGRVEIITNGGEVAEAAEVPESSGELELTIPTGGSYYYLRILREEEIAAVTAPVWVETYEDLGIEGWTAANVQPETGTEAELQLTLYNHEQAAFVVESVVLSAGERILETQTNPGRIDPLGTLSLSFLHREEEPGAVTLTVTVTGTVGGNLRTFQKNITLRFRTPEAPMVTVKDLRAGLLGDAYRISGYVTAGTSNPHNTFPNSIYLQDDTGGIQVVDFTETGIQLGTPMEIEGILRSSGGNLVLAMTDSRILDTDFYRYVPETMAHEAAMDYEAHGGELLQLQGKVVSVTKTPDKKGVARFTLRDAQGDLATVMIEDGIGSGAYGTNELVSEVKTRRTVRAMGLLHIDEYGKTVLRVRNCDEVVYVPPRKDPSNPKTGDWLAYLLSRW